MNMKAVFLRNYLILTLKRSVVLLECSKSGGALVHRSQY